MDEDKRTLPNGMEVDFSDLRNVWDKLYSERMKWMKENGDNSKINNKPFVDDFNGKFFYPCTPKDVEEAEQEIQGFINSEGFISIIDQFNKKIAQEKQGVYSKKVYPTKVEGETFSVDVITCDETDLLCVGFYDYEDEKWYFHTDTLVDYYEKDKEMNFVWMYKPEYLKVN